MLVREGRKIRVERRVRAYEILGFSKKEKLEKCQELYEHLLYNSGLKLSDDHSDSETRYYFCVPSKGESVWKAFKDLGKTISGFLGSEGGCTYIVHNDSRTNTALKDANSIKDGSTDIHKVDNLNDYSGVYVTNYTDGSKRKITFFVGKKPQGYISIDFKKSQKWLEDTLGKKINDLLNYLKNKFKKVTPIFA